jgi:peroxiredoxin
MPHRLRLVCARVHYKFLIFGLLLGFSMYLMPVMAFAQPTAPPATTKLPDLQITKTDGTQLATKDIKGPAILIYFFPDCDHCQREATEISKHLKAFQKYAVYFISSAELNKISEFAKTYKLAGQSNIHFARASSGDIYRQVGGIPTPSLYVYSGGQLKNTFKGETPIDKILKGI